MTTSLVALEFTPGSRPYAAGTPSMGSMSGETNSASMISVVSGQHPDLAFDYAVAHQAQLSSKIDTTSRSRYYPGLAGNSLDPAMIGKLKAYADKNIAASSRRATDTAVANITYRSQVKKERLPAIGTWLGKHGG